MKKYSYMGPLTFVAGALWPENPQTVSNPIDPTVAAPLKTLNLKSSIAAK